MSIGDYHMIHPGFLWLLLLIPALVFFYILYYRKKTPTLGISDIAGVLRRGKSIRQGLRHAPFVLRMLAIVPLVFAMTQPESNTEKREVKVEGIDILIASDISGSMLAQDFKPNRLEASREVAYDFINGRPDDRIGLVIFSAESFLQCPLTIDHARLVSLYGYVKSGMISDGTAIGDGLGLSVYHLKKSEAISKVIILMTDGINNTGSLDPLTAADIAKKFGIRVYTIGVGTIGKAPYPVMTPYGIQTQPMDVMIDEDLLEDIANSTGGKYFRATDKQKLAQIYAEIDKLEKSKIDVTRFNRGKPEFMIFVLIGAALLVLESLFRYLILRRIP